jgi:hypothetical protein
MTVALIELLAGLYFFGISISYVKSVITVDMFKLVFGVVLILVALLQGTKLI